MIRAYGGVSTVDALHASTCGVHAWGEAPTRMLHGYLDVERIDMAATVTTDPRYALRSALALTKAELQETRDLTLVGVVKWALEPFSYMAIYFVLVGAILDRPRYGFPLFLLSALVPWRFFTGTTIDSLAMLKRYGEVIKNHAFPREVIPLVLLFAQGVTFLIACVFFIPLMIYYRVDPWPHLLWFPLLLAQLFVLSAGPTYAGVVVGLYFPDYREIIRNLIRLAFFASSALVPIEEVPGDTLPFLLQLNPLTGVFDSFRAVLLYETAPSALDLVYPFGFGGLVLLVAFFVYRKYQNEFPKEA